MIKREHESNNKLIPTKTILKTQSVKYPLSFKAGNFTELELEEFSQLIQSKERG